VGRQFRLIHGYKDFCCLFFIVYCWISYQLVDKSFVDFYLRFIANYAYTRVLVLGCKMSLFHFSWIVTSKSIIHRASDLRSPFDRYDFALLNLVLIFHNSLQLLAIKINFFV